MTHLGGDQRGGLQGPEVHGGLPGARIDLGRSATIAYPELG
jgi:hypothetical protein